jgi:hypothetical protein
MADFREVDGILSPRELKDRVVCAKVGGNVLPLWK